AGPPREHAGKGTAGVEAPHGRGERDEGEYRDEGVHPGRATGPRRGQHRRESAQRQLPEPREGRVVGRDRIDRREVIGPPARGGDGDEEYARKGQRTITARREPGEREDQQRIEEVELFFDGEGPVVRHE